MLHHLLEVKDDVSPDVAWSWRLVLRAGEAEPKSPGQTDILQKYCCLYRFMQQCQLSTGLVELTYLQSSKAAAARNTPSAAD